jgi:hypothetical protein
MLNATFKSVRTVVAAAALMLVATAAQAGPPLICHPFETGQTSLLPWANAPGWNTPDPSYDVTRLVADTTRLLAPETPVLPRMETLRRATIYASQRRDVAFELLTAVLGRALAAQAADSRDPLLLLDAAYVIEAFRQAGGLHRWATAASREKFFSRELGDLRGHAFMDRAITLSGGKPELEFAASLMYEGPTAAEHRRRAVAGAQRGSLLAKNLERVN